MDRNTNFNPASLFDLPSLSARRAWIEIVFRGWTLNINGSLSARRAWIEIFYYADKDADWVVALRKESVDRNVSSLSMSCSAVKVALRKESVDRNSTALASMRVSISRSPQGERG